MAEVTGLKPKQVTIWFQNRRNRKGRRGPKPEPTTPPPNFEPLLEQSRTPSSPPTRDFTLSEKKRKTYGTLGRASPSPFDSDSDDSSLNLKKPRLPRACSTTSEASASSLELEKSFTSWSSPPSRSASSSSASSSASVCSDSPGRAHNVFRLINPLKYEGHVKQDMPAVTMATPPRPTYAGVRQEQRSPLVGDRENPVTGYPREQRLDFHTESSELKLNFGDLQFNQEALHKGLRESIQKALDIDAMRQGSERSVSSSSWGSMESATTDDDGWVDEDEGPSAPLCNTPVTGTVVDQRAPIFSVAPQQSQSSSTSWTASHSQTGSGDTSTDSSFSYTTPDENDSFYLSQFFESAAVTNAPLVLPSSSPFVPHQHNSPQAPLITTSSTAGPAAGMDTSNSCLDFEVEMADIQDYLNSSFLAAAPSQASMTGAQGEVTGGDGSQAQAQGEEAPAQFYLNFDLSPEMFSLG
ncbi:hypothetical protein NDA16_001031 [Ustilago loliicola]|nr:hypothetical protein NDA16_001031 [Ustilago loliicola]